MLAVIMAFTVIAVPTSSVAYAEDTVNAMTVEGLSVEGIEESYSYTGSVIEPDVIVIYNGITLTEGTDYNVSYSNNVSSGTATMTITGMGAYTWTETVPFNIVGTDLSDAVVKLEYSNYSYTGKARVPKPTVTLDDKVLKANKDYVVKYANNTYPGIATVTVEGIGAYSSSAETTFYIAKIGSLTLKSRGATTLKLSWSKKSGVTGYQIRRYNETKEAWGVWKTVKDDDTNTFTIGKLPEAAEHQIKVRAFVTDEAGTTYYGEDSPVLETVTKPGKVDFTSLKTNLKMQLKIKWAKEAGDGYQIYVSRNSKFSSPSKYTIDSQSTLSKNIQAKKNNINYYVKVRAYKIFEGKKVYGSWSKVRKIKTDGTGWSTSNNRKYYYRNGSKLKGTHTISGSQYFFDKNSGVLLGTSATMYENIKKKKSGTKYLISVDRRKNRTVVYHKSEGDWVVKYYWKCSTGAPSDYSTLSCTPSGTFKVPKKRTHQKYFGDRSGYRCWYTTRIYKGYLFHSVLYQPYSGTRIQDGRLGYNISHGCIRLAKDNAYWLYKNIDAGTTVVILRK